MPDGSDLAVIPFGAISRDEQSKLSDLTVANGVKLGRKLKLTHHQQLPAEAVRWHGQIGQKSFKLYMWVTQNLISLALCLIAHDWGGWVGFLLSIRQPERIQRYLAWWTFQKVKIPTFGVARSS